MKRIVIWLVLVILTPFSINAALTEVERIRSHLRLVEELLRRVPVTNLSDEQKVNREVGLNVLNEYWRRGEFPQNIYHEGQRHPYFIDHRGVACAVGQIMLNVHGKELAYKIAREQNYKYLDQIEGKDVSDWISQSGFTVDELRLIQPNYGYSARYKDPLVEAAFLADRQKFDQILAGEPLKGSPVAMKVRLNDSLRALAPFAHVGRPAESSEGQSIGIYYKPAPRKGTGIEFVKYLLELKADPNYLNNGEHSTTYLTKDPLVRSLLVAAGGKLTPVENLMEAIERSDFTSIDKYLDDKSIDLYPKTQRFIIPPLSFALSKVRAPQRIAIEKSQDLAMKTVYKLLTHSAKRVSIHEKTTFKIDYEPLKLNYQTHSFLDRVIHRQFDTVIAYLLSDKKFDVIDIEEFKSLLEYFMIRKFELDKYTEKIDKNLAKDLEEYLLKSKNKKWIDLILHKDKLYFKRHEYRAEHHLKARNFLRKLVGESPLVK